MRKYVDWFWCPNWTLDLKGTVRFNSGNPYISYRIGKLCIRRWRNKKYG